MIESIHAAERDAHARPMAGSLHRIRRNLTVFGIVLGAGLGVGIGTGTAYAKDYPEHPIKLVVPVVPGAAIDAAARLLAEKMSASLKQTVIVDNRPGGGSIVANVAVAKAPADGYTVLFGSTALIQQPSLYSTLPYDAMKDFAPVSQIVGYPAALVVPASSRANTVAQFMELARSSSPPLPYGSPGIGTTPHLYGEVISAKAGAGMLHVAYKGEAPLVNDLLGGQVRAAFVSVLSSTPLIKTGNLKALAVIGTRRSPLLPDVPTFAEAGVSGFEAVGWSGLLVPAKTPGAIVQKLAAAAQDAMRNADLRSRFIELGMVPMGSSPQEFTKTLKADHDMWRKVIHDAGVKLD